MLLGLLLGIIQLGVLFFADTGLKSAVAEGARLASTYPRPNDAAIRAHITATRFGLQPAYLSTPTIQHGNTSGRDHVTIGMTYAAPVNFLFVPITTVTLSEQRRAYVHPA